jgi:inorganic triphosphatase YgiF
MVELEGTLIICSNEPEEIVARLADLTAIAGYRLLPQDDLHILDTYFDTPDGQLWRNLLGLRVRQANGRSWIALKGQPKFTEWGGIERIEVEGEWAQNAMGSVTAELKRLGIVLQPPQFDPDKPLHAMASLGLRQVQTRRNHRKVRNVVRAEADKPLAELVIDSVEFVFEDRIVRHYEVEVESKVENGSEVLKALMESLVEQLHPWMHDKLLMGKAIQEMLPLGRLQDLIDTRHNLKPAAYDAIDEYIKHSTTYLQKPEQEK